jgi:two-component system, OmpR family, manganese sensing sensor histidine kinase
VFQKIRYQLLLSYLVVLAGVLTVFAIAVRLVFTHSLNSQKREELTILAKSAAATAEFEQGRLSVGDEFSTMSLVSRDEALQWFDLKGKMIAQQGEDAMTLPLVTDDPIQIQNGKERILAVTLPIISSDNHQLVGYVRVSASLDSVEETIRRLDWGLGSGILIALVLSGLGGLWLTRQATKPAEASFQRLKQFTADASHELRSPLTAIKSNAAVALKYPEGMRPSDQEKFEAIASATNQMTRLTEDLLLLARTDQIANFKPALVALADVLNHLVVLYQPQADAKQIQLSAQLTNDLEVWGDAVQLNRVFANLIENSLRYTPDKGSIEIQSQTSHHQVQVSVQDTGIGIAPEHLDRVFDRFWQADQSRSHQVGGSGLGLAIVQAIVQQHGGSIAVTSEPGKGSCFTVQLPASKTQRDS